ncbi:MAG: hypothetical protein AAF844_05970 [Pseudomonadota bacterium]
MGHTQDHLAEQVADRHGVSRVSTDGDGDASSAAPKMRDYLYPDSITFWLREDEIIDGFRWLGGMPATAAQRPVLQRALACFRGKGDGAFVQLKDEESRGFIGWSTRAHEMSVWLRVTEDSEGADLTAAYVPPLSDPGEELKSGTVRLFGHFPFVGHDDDSPVANFDSRFGVGQPAELRGDDFPF